MVNVANLHYHLPDKRKILEGISFHLNVGAFLAVLGENGAGKTTLLDTLMGFRVRTGGEITVMGVDPGRDPWKTRFHIAYLSEKVDIPGDWDASDFFAFHRHFYPNYDSCYEHELMGLFAVRSAERVGNLSAGELRRIQIIAALATRPELVIADEITAVLDILGRRKFLKALQDHQRSTGMSVILATNIPEGLEAFADYVLLIHEGQSIAFSEKAQFLGEDHSMADAAARRLEAS